MNRNLIFCSDGTGNAFAQRSSNVSTLVHCLDLRSRSGTDLPQQMAFYAQGVGTNPELIRDAHHYSVFNAEAEMLKVLPEPRRVSWLRRPVAWLAGMAFGCGLRDNIREMARALSAHYEPGDKIYLFGFSRGAFTVRAFAGFLYRCGIPGKSITDFGTWFEEAFSLYEPTEEPAAAPAFRARGRVISIEFLGIWDTVKAYGGIRPIGWSHLRHNPIIGQVRHALAIDERRAWFQHTTWGNQRENLTGVPLPPDTRYEQQIVKEVWFSGCHSDVGGGDDEKESARVSFLWMLGEAVQCGVRLNQEGERRFECTEDLNRAIEPHNSFHWYWWLLGLLPRQELDNHSRPALRPWVIKARVRRDLDAPPYCGKRVLVHKSAMHSRGLSRYQAEETYVPTRASDLEHFRSGGCD